MGNKKAFKMVKGYGRLKKRTAPPGSGWIIGEGQFMGLSAIGRREKEVSPKNPSVVSLKFFDMNLKRFPTAAPVIKV